jgi:hypothetical protein
MTSLRRPLEYAVITLVALVISHNIIFMLAYGAGYDEALAHSGHDGAWGSAVAITLAAASGLFGLGTWRIYRLGVLACALADTQSVIRPEPIRFVRQLVGLWMRLAGATTLVFFIQENVEHLRVGEAMPGLAVLGSAEYPYATVIVGAVALGVAFVVALFRWQRDVLVARITAARLRWRRAWPTVEPRQAVWVERRHASIVFHQVSGRAPPQLSHT